jgi:hypothetical protein
MFNRLACLINAGVIKIISLIATHLTKKKIVVFVSFVPLHKF